MSYLNQFLFGIYPYIALAVFFVGSLVRFDRDQYTWKSDSSQLLRAGQLRWGSNLFHIGILGIFFGHLVGLLTPIAICHTLRLPPRATHLPDTTLVRAPRTPNQLYLIPPVHRRLTD